MLTAALFASTTVALILIAASLSTFGSLFSSEFHVLETRSLHAEMLSTTATGEGVGSNINRNATTNSPLLIRSGMLTMRILGRLWRQQRFLPPSQDPSCLVFQEPDSKVGKSTDVDRGKGSISKVENDPQARPWAVFERWRLEKDSISSTAHMGRPWSRIRRTKLVSIQAFQGGQHQSADGQCKLLGNMDDTEDLDDFQKRHVDRIVERKIEEQPGFEWSLVGAQLFSTEKKRHQNLPSEERRLEDYLDVSIRGMAHDFANLSNYHRFEQLIMDRHLSKDYLMQLVAGRPRLDKGDGFDLAQLHPLEEKVPEKEIDEAELVNKDVVEDELPQTDIAQGEYSEIGIVKTTAQLSKTHENRDLLYGFAKRLGANAPGDSVVPTGSRVSQALHDEGDPLLPVYSSSPQRVELANTRSREKARQKRIEASQNLTKKWESVLGLRLRAREARNSLGHERETLSNHDAQLVQRLRAVIANNSLAEQTPLLDELEDLQKSRDNLQPKKDNYNKLEDQLNREEWELKELELSVTDLLRLL